MLDIKEPKDAPRYATKEEVRELITYLNKYIKSETEQLHGNIVEIIENSGEQHGRVSKLEYEHKKLQEKVDKLQERLDGHAKILEVSARLSGTLRAG